MTSYQKRCSWILSNKFEIYLAKTHHINWQFKVVRHLEGREEFLIEFDGVGQLIFAFVYKILYGILRVSKHMKVGEVTCGQILGYLIPEFPIEILRKVTLLHWLNSLTPPQTPSLPPSYGNVNKCLIDFATVMILDNLFTLDNDSERLRISSFIHPSNDLICLGLSVIVASTSQLLNTCT